MFYRKNVGSKEGIAPIALGAAIAGVSLFHFGAAQTGWGLAAGGACLAVAFPLAAGPACALIGRRLKEPGS